MPWWRGVGSGLAGLIGGNALAVAIDGHGLQPAAAQVALEAWVVWAVISVNVLLYQLED